MLIIQGRVLELDMNDENSEHEQGDYINKSTYLFLSLLLLYNNIIFIQPTFISTVIVTKRKRKTLLTIYFSGRSVLV